MRCAKPTQPFVTRLPQRQLDTENIHYLALMTRLCIATIAAFGLSTIAAQAQIAASFTVSHMGLQPSAEATVNVGDTVKFIYGGGGPHPMTSGHNSTASPTFFPTVTVTSGAPEATFTLEEAGVYFFHCGTNPMNANNWGTLTVVDPNNPTRVDESSAPAWTLQSNSVRGTVTLQGEHLPSEVVLYNNTGQEVRRWNPSLTQGELSVEGLSQGLYVICGDNNLTWSLWIQ